MKINEKIKIFLLKIIFSHLNLEWESKNGSKLDYKNSYPSLISFF